MTVTMMKAEVVMGLIVLMLAVGPEWAQPPSAESAAVVAAPPGHVGRIKVQPDKAPDCSSLKSIAESVTRGCKTNDAKAIAIYNFMLLTHYHCPYAREDGGIPAIKEINVYGWGVCGGTSSVMSALWRQLGWSWRFVGWPGHTTVEARYEDRWHYLDAFLKWYVWMPDGKGGWTVAGEEDILKNRKELWDDAFVLDAGRKVGYMKSDRFVMVDGKANWQARDFMDCDYVWMLQKDEKGNFKGGVPKQLSKVGPAESWGGYNHADGDYSTDVDLAPGSALTNTWDALYPDGWYGLGSSKPPSHSCSGYADTRNSPGLGLVLEPYIDAKPARSYGNGLLTFFPDFSSNACLKLFLSADNVKCAEKALMAAEAGRPAVLVVELASPYVMTKASGEAAGAEKVEVSVDNGKTFKALELKGFDDAVKGKLAVQVRITFAQALRGLKLEAIVQNNPCALPYLSPGKNRVQVSAAEPKALGENRLVVTFADRLGGRSLSLEQICQQGKRVAQQVGAKWSDQVTFVQKSYAAEDLPATLEIDCPTPKGQYPVYPRMIFLRREVLAPGQKPLALPEGAVQAGPVPPEDLQTLPNPLLVGTERPRQQAPPWLSKRNESEVYLTSHRKDSPGQDCLVPRKGTPVFSMISFLPIALVLAVGMVILLPGLSGSAAESPRPIVAFILADLPEVQFEQGAWSTQISEGGIRCRQALAGKFAAARVKAWWKEGQLRPPEGERFVLEVRYKDIVAKPATFHIFSGIGRNFGYWAVHQFGGAKDGQWKTASIPVPWDMVARLVSTLDPARDAPDMTAFAVSASADLPVASVAVRKAVPDDEERFYAECRAMIASAQAEARAKNPPPVVRNPAVTGPMAAFPWEPSCRLFQNCAGVPGQMGKPVRLRMCLNELEPGSFGVYANAALTGVDYQVTPLTDASGKTLQATIERRTAEYAPLDEQWTPMRLWPAYAVDIPAGRSHWFFFNVETQREVSAAGTYRGKILITAKEGKAELPLEVEVLPVDLLTMDEAGLTMFGCYDRLPPLHDVEFQRRYNYGGALLWYAGFAPAVALREGKLAFDFTYPDDWMKGARQRGFSGAIWYLGGDSAKMPRTLKVFAHLGTLDKKMNFDQWCSAQNGQDHVLPETRKLFVEWMRQVNAHAVDSGWLELFPTPHDEPQKWASIAGWIKPFFKDACAAIREADPRIRVYGCIHHVKGWKGVPDLWSVFIDDIDVYNTNAVGEDPDVGNKVRAAGAESVKKGGKDKLFWQYTGLGSGVPDSQRYAFGFFFGAFGSTGCTAWAYNWNDVWDLSGRKGDLAVTAWPTAYQTIPSPWFEAQREGLDDRRIIATYQKRFARDAEAMEALEAVLTEARTSRSKGSGENKEAGFHDSIDDSAKLIRWRNALLGRLANAHK